MRHLISLALFAAALFFSVPASAGVYVTDQPDSSATFCQAVATTRQSFCPRMRVDCPTLNTKATRAKTALLRAAAKKCGGDHALDETEAAKALADHYKYQPVLCCPDEAPVTKKKRTRHHKKHKAS